MNEHEKFIKDLGFDEFSNLGDYLEFLRNGQEDVCINLLGNLLDASKEKGKLEQKKEDFDYLFENWDGYDKTANMIINDFKRQLQKEIGDDSQQPRMKQTRGGELKSDEGLHSTDNGSPADIVSKKDSEDICICGHHKKDHSYDPNKLDADLECDICNCMEFKTKEDRSFLGGYAEFWDNPEDDRWDKEEEKQDE